MKKKIILPVLFFSGLFFSQVGINTETPQKTLHVNGDIQVIREINVGGDSSTAGNPGISGQVLTSSGPNVAPVWQNAKDITGNIANAYYVQGTNELQINSGSKSDVPGVTLTHTVPPGKSQTLLFTILGYAVRSSSINGQAAQGVFTLLQNGVKISSAFTSSGDGGDLNNLPAPTTFLKTVTLSEGTYTFIVQYAAWSDNQSVNYTPSNYLGFDGDDEAMLTKMQVLVYNN